MPANTSVQLGSSRPTIGVAQFLACSLVGAFVIVSIVISLEASAAAARSSVETSLETVNRSRKADRLPAFSVNATDQRLNFRILRAPASDLKLAEGCEALFSSLTHSQLARIAGRCVS
jgi:hypothetical protein